MTVIHKGKKTSAHALFAIYTLAAAFLLALTLKNSSLAAEGVGSALELCAKMLIPALFPTMIAAEIATELCLFERIPSRILTPLSKLLGISRTACCAYILGLLGGYTASASSAVSLFKIGAIDRRDFENTVSISSVPSLAFLTGFVGTKILGSQRSGWLLWALSVLSTVILAMLKKLLRGKKTGTSPKSPQISRAAQKSTSFSRAVVTSISRCASSMLIICACVVFFSSVMAALRPILLSLGVEPKILNILLGLLEVTSGTSACAEIEDPAARASVCAALSGFSGLCVHFQIITVCDGTGISYPKLFLTKAAQATVCALLAGTAFSVFK